MSTIQHMQTELNTVHELKNGFKVKGSIKKRAIYHKQRGANTKSITLQRTISQVENSESSIQYNARMTSLVQGREARRIKQKLERQAKRRKK